jgi:hypothetical protein
MSIHIRTNHPEEVVISSVVGSVGQFRVTQVPLPHKHSSVPTRLEILRHRHHVKWQTTRLSRNEWSILYIMLWMQSSIYNR